MTCIDRKEEERRSTIRSVLRILLTAKKKLIYVTSQRRGISNAKPKLRIPSVIKENVSNKSVIKN